MKGGSEEERERETEKKQGYLFSEQTQEIGWEGELERERS